MRQEKEKTFNGKTFIGKKLFAMAVSYTHLDGDEKRCSCEADERGIRKDRSRARRKRRYRVDQCDGAVKERTFLRERKEYYHNYVKKD